MSRFPRAIRTLLVCTGFLLTAVAVVGVRAADTDIDPNNPLPSKHKASASDLLRQRILEAESGQRDNIGHAPKTQTLLGPDLSDREKALQVLNRTSYGPRPGEVEKVVELGYKEWVKRQLTPDSIDDSECDAAVAKRYPWTKMNINEVYDKYASDKQSRKELYKGLPDSCLYRAVMSKRQFKEVMVDFWRNHFCIDQPHTDEKSRSWTSVDYEEQVIRKNVFGKFKMMLFESARHPAMLEYLDQELSKKGEWNENYAREVMELHTLGADKGYTDRDVLELSKVLTGWRYNKSYHFEFDKAWHQPGPKFWLGRQVAEGYNGGELCLYTLATHKNTATFIATKLVRYLVNDNPPPNLVAQVASVFMESQGDLPKVYAAILNSPEFMKRENYRAKFKTPYWFAVSALRSTDAQVASLDETAKVIGTMGEPVYECPDPTGFFDQAERWMDSGVLTKRWDYGLNLARGGVGGVSIPPTFVNRYSGLKPEDLEVKLIEDLIGGDVGDRELHVLHEAAAQNDMPQMLGIVLGSPSFQQK